MRGLSLADPAFLAAAAGFTPLTLSPALWLDAADASTITSSGSPAKVSQWNDKSGNLRHAKQSTSANQPVTGSTTQNSRNVISFTASSSQFMTTDNGFDWSTTGVSIFVIAKCNDTADFKIAIAQQDDGANIGRVVYAFDTGEQPYSNIGAGQDLLTATTSWLLVRITMASGSNQTKSLVKNAGAETVTATRTLNESAGTLRIGSGKGVASSFMDGHIGEIIIYPTVLSAINISSVETYLNAKWAVY